jgi:hypothetical protein
MDLVASEPDLLEHVVVELGDVLISPALRARS